MYELSSFTATNLNFTGAKNAEEHLNNPSLICFGNRKGYTPILKPSTECLRSEYMWVWFK